MPGAEYQTEVLVIGAGPGGSAAAWALAHAGHEVLLIDRAGFPRDKTCGDGLTPLAVRSLSQMGVLEQVESAGAARLDSVRLTGPFGMSITAPFTEFMEPGMRYALVLPRLTLDDILRRHALAAGAAYMGGVHVERILRDDDMVSRVEADGPHGPLMFRAQHVILAVGANIGLLAREGFVRRRRKMVLAARGYYTNVSLTAKHYDFHFDLELLPGYAWIFPTGDSSANIGAGVYPTFWASRKPARVLLDEFIGRQQARGELAGVQLSGPVKGYPLRVDYPAERVAGHNWLLVGEAAGLVNPVTGEGIDLALESGLMAAETLHESMRRGRSSHLAYQIRLWDRFGPLFNGLHAVRDTLVNPALLDYVLWVMGQHRFLSKTILRIAQGLQMPHDLLHPLALLQFMIPLSPRFIWQELGRQRRPGQEAGRV
ncbi:MAG: menaquinone reductase [Anaerolineae bacterium]